MALFQNGVDVSRYQGSINWTQVAAAGKQFAIVRVGSSNSGGLYVDPYFLQNVTGAHSAGLRVGAYYYTYARTRAAVASELTAFLNMLEGIKLEYPVFVDVEDSSLTSLGRAELTSLVQYAMDILYQRKWYAGWYSYTNYINSYLNAGALADYPLWVADYRATLGYTGAYTMWQYSGSGTVTEGSRGQFSREYLDRTVKMQKTLLDKAIRLLKPGHELVYSTCSILPQENEAQIKAFLERHPEYEVWPMGAELPEKLAAHENAYGLQMFAHRDGFYVCRMRRVKA